jgi:hypothetical protein
MGSRWNRAWTRGEPILEPLAGHVIRALTRTWHDSLLHTGFWKCYKTLTFWWLLTRCTIPCTCHAKRHLNLQKWSVHGVFWTFWLGNVLRATAACTFATSQLPKVVRSWFCTFSLRNVLRAGSREWLLISGTNDIILVDYWCLWYLMMLKIENPIQWTRNQ